jgi:hypothetical protein
MNRLGIIAWLSVSCCWILLIWFSFERYRGPELLAVETVSRMSGARVRSVLQELVGDAIPHPAGSPQHEIVRARIVAHAEQSGYEVLVHDTEHFPRRNPQNAPIALKNLMFRLPGSAPPEQNAPVVLAAHYDSVPTAPGAGDDGVGVAVVLEIARRLKQASPPWNDVIFLITDGEELGLLGAERWVEQHPWAQQAKWAINFEARGTRGASLMFETSDDNAWLIPLLADRVTRPNANSLSYEIYRLLPNDTDFSIFRRAGMAGFNFAFIGDVRNYHTAGDNWENVSPNSIQHHADNAWQTIQACANYRWPVDAQGQRVSIPKPGQVVYFDWFGWFLFYWPTSWNWPLLGLATFVMALWSGLEPGSEKPQSMPVISGLLRQWLPAVVVAIVGLAVVAALVTANLMLLRLSPRLELSWPLTGHWVHLSLLCSGALGWLGVAQLARRWLTRRMAFWGMLTPWLALAAALIWWIPGGCFVALIPVLLAAMAIMIGSIVGRSVEYLAIGWAVAVSLIWFPLEPMLYDALGMGAPMIFAVRMAWLTSCLWPVMSLLSVAASKVCALQLGILWLVLTVAGLI